MDAKAEKSKPPRKSHYRYAAGRLNGEFEQLRQIILNALGANEKSKGQCPACGKHAVTVDRGDKVPIVVHCFTCKAGKEIVQYLIRAKAWPTTTKLRSKAREEVEQKPPGERMHWALDIWNALHESGTTLRPFLEPYFSARGIDVPDTAIAVMPLFSGQHGARYSSHDPGVLLPVYNAVGEQRGFHVLWLHEDLKRKAEGDRPKQTFGLLRGNFIYLGGFDFDKPPKTLCIAEGVETALAMSKLTGHPAIATGGQGFFAGLRPPKCAEYIIAPDCSDDDSSRREVAKLARWLHLDGAKVYIALPRKAEGGKSGYDWNDALMDAGNDKTARVRLKENVSGAPRFPVDNTDDADRLEIAKLAKVRNDTLEFSHRKGVFLTAYRKTHGVSLSAKDLQALIDEAALELRKRSAAERIETHDPKAELRTLAFSAQKIIASEDVLQLLLEDVSRFIVGEERNLALLYLMGTSRLFEQGETMHAVVKGVSSSGKSQMRDRVLDYFPEEDIIAFTSLSERALIYDDRGFEHKIISMAEAQDEESIKLQDLFLRELMSSGKLRYPTVQKVGGVMQTIIIEKDGPVVFMVTTTKNKLHEENETRMLSLHSDESPEQTAAVVDKVMTSIGLGKKQDETQLIPWHNFQRWLAKGERRIVVPFAPVLGAMMRSYQSQRLRRDAGQLLAAIKAHALIHREHRKRDKAGRIIATVNEDYRTARLLMADIMTTAVELRQRQDIADTVAAVNELAPVGTAPEECATVHALALQMRLSTPAVRRRLNAAIDLGLIENTETRRGQRAHYRATGEKVPDQGAGLLPTTKTLARAVREARMKK
jgi:hypothetical protein